MRKFFFGLAAGGGLFALVLAGPLHAQTAAPDAQADNDSAYTALRAMAKSLGKETLDRVAEVSGRDGKPQPTQWKIILRETTGEGSREVDVAGGKVTAQEPDSQSPAAKGLIHLSDLNLDSSGAFDATDAQARKVRLRFDSVNYVLRTSEATGKPQWSLTLFNKDGTQVGAMRLAAHDGNIVSIDGRLASNPTPAPTPTPAVVSSVKRTETVSHPPPACHRVHDDPYDGISRHHHDDCGQPHRRPHPRRCPRRRWQRSPTRKHGGRNPRRPWRGRIIYPHGPHARQNESHRGKHARPDGSDREEHSAADRIAIATVFHRARCGR